MVNKQGRGVVRARTRGGWHKPKESAWCSVNRTKLKGKIAHEKAMLATTPPPQPLLPLQKKLSLSPKKPLFHVKHTRVTVQNPSAIKSKKRTFL